MKLRVVLAGILVAASILSFVLAAPASDLRAADAGGCTAYINNVDVSAYDTPGNPFEVDYDASVVVRVDAPQRFTSHKVDMAFMGLFAWTVSEETDTGTGTSYQTTVDVADYADYGLGIYKVTATGVLANGDTCTAVVFVRIVGQSFLSTIAGIVALLFAVGGLLGLILLIVLIFMGIVKPSLLGCLALPIAVVIIPLAMVTGGGQSTNAGGAPQVPSGSQDTPGAGMKFRLKISILAIGCALLSAIGFVALFQQMGSVFPTITIVVLSLVLGLVAGILLPSLAATFARRRK